MMNKLLVKLQCAHNQTVNTFSYNLSQDEQIVDWPCFGDDTRNFPVIKLYWNKCCTADCYIQKNTHKKQNYRDWHTYFFLNSKTHILRDSVVSVTIKLYHAFSAVCACVCVCVFESKRERLCVSIKQSRDSVNEVTYLCMFVELEGYQDPF